MILIIGRFQVKSEWITQFQEFARHIIPEQQQVKGCLRFEILQDVGRPDHFVMLEEWQNQAVLDAHFETETYHENDAKLYEFVVDEPEWLEYEV